jgi:hypothetical protein
VVARHVRFYKAFVIKSRPLAEQNVWYCSEHGQFGGWCAFRTACPARVFRRQLSLTRVLASDLRSNTPFWNESGWRDERRWASTEGGKISRSAFAFTS